MKDGIYLSNITVSKIVRKKKVSRKINDVVVSFENNILRHKDLVLNRALKHIKSKTEKKELQIDSVTPFKWISTFS